MIHGFSTVRYPLTPAVTASAALGGSADKAPIHGVLSNDRFSVRLRHEHRNVEIRRKILQCPFSQLNFFGERS